MAAIDFDEFNAKLRTPLSWRETQSIPLSDCTLSVNGGARTYPVHLHVLSASSVFFFRVSCERSTQASKETTTANSRSYVGEVQVKTQSGQTVMLGRTSESVGALKREVQEALGMPEELQRLFIREEKGKDKELDEDWRTLESCGLRKEGTVLVMARKPWQRLDAEKNVLQLTVPEACEEALEGVLDYMYGRYDAQESIGLFPAISRKKALAVLWWAGHFEIVKLQLEMVAYLEKQINGDNAHEHLETCMKLGFVKVSEGMMQHAASHADRMPVSACDKLPLDRFERMMEMMNVPNASKQVVQRRRSRVLASYLRAYERSGRLDSVAYERLVKAWFRGTENNENAMAAEDALFLLKLGIKFSDEAVKEACLRCAAANLGKVRVEDVSELGVEVTIGLLSQDELVVSSEDEVYEMVRRYIEGRGGQLGVEDRRGLWGCCRFAYCSVQVQAELARVREAGMLAEEFMWGVVTERMKDKAVRRQLEGFTAATCHSKQTRPRKRAQVEDSQMRFGIGDQVSPSLSVSVDRKAISRDNSGCAWKAALLEPEVCTAQEAYVEFLIEQCDGACHICLGVTSDQSAVELLHNLPSSRTYFCGNSTAWPGNRQWGGNKQRRKQGDRVGLLVKQGRLWVYVNGTQLGHQAMADDLPPRVRFAVDISTPGARVRVVEGAVARRRAQMRRGICIG